MYRAEDYRVLVGRDRVTGDYVAIVREFPSLSWVSEETRHLAARGMRSLLDDVLADMYDAGEEPPAPHSSAVSEPAEEGLRELIVAA